MNGLAATNVLGVDSTPINAESNLRLTDFVFETLPILPEHRTYGLTVTYRF